MAASNGQTVVDRLQAAIHTIDGSEMAKTVCKASTHELGPPKLKHLQKLQQLTREHNVNQPELLNLIVLRTKEKSWIVVGKALVTCHHLLVNGNERFLQSSATRPSLFTLEMFTDATHYEMSNFIKLYANYLNKRATSYRTMACDFCKLKKGKDSLWNKMEHEKLIKQVPVLQELLNTLMKFNSTNPQFGNPVVNSAFQLLHRDLVRLYATYNDAMIVVISKFYDMKMSHCKIAFKIYKDFLDHLDQFKKFFELAERVGCIVDKGDVPDLSKAPRQLLAPFQEHVNNGVDSNQSTPAKTSGRGSNLASPVQLSGNGQADMASEALREEARALEKFSRNKQPTPTNPISQKLQDQQNLQNNPVSISASAFQQQPFQEQSTPAAEPAKTNFSDDLLNFGNELSFGQNVMNNISQNSAQPPQQASQNSFDPFGMAPGSQNTVPSASNPFNMTASSPMMMGGQQQQQQQPMGGGNPFGNPFAGNMMPNLQQPQVAQPQVQATDPFADLLGMSNAAPAQQPAFDPFGNTNVLTPSNLQAQPTSPQPTSNKPNSAVFGSDLDDTLNNMMNFNLMSNNKPPATTTSSNPNNPFAF